MKKQPFVICIILSLLISAIIYISTRKSTSASTNINTAYGLTEYKEEFDHTNPRQVCDYFCVNLFLAPKQAYTLFSKDYGNTTLKQFLKTRKIILPPSKTVTSIAFSKVEHGFTNMPSELESSVYTYKVKSKDDFQPNIILEIDVFEKENVYYVLRYGVTSELTPIR